MSPAALNHRRTPILFVHWGDEGIRGSERVLLDLLTGIDRSRFVPALWCNTETMANAAAEIELPARVSRMPILLGWDSPRLDISAYRALMREGQSLIRELGARLVHANSAAPNQWMVPVARRELVPLVAHLHAVYGFRDRCTLLLHQVPFIVACSEAAASPLRSDGFPESRVRVIYNGVDPIRLNEGDAHELRASLGVAGEAVLVVAVGALVRVKGFDVVMRALQVLSARGVDTHLAIVGEGPQRAELEALAREVGIRSRVHFLGQQKNVGAILRDAADVVAVGSRIESFGLVAAEAGALGRAVVGTKVGGMPEVVDDGKTGILVPSEDHVAFADALAALAKDPALREKLGAAARERVLSRFTAQHAAKSFEELYSALTSQPRESFGWSRLGFRTAPFARLGFAILRRRLGARVPDG
jgi:glycosyltransferase involved in cell wall biosynthesis